MQVFSHKGNFKYLNFIAKSSTYTAISS